MIDAMVRWEQLFGGLAKVSTVNLTGKNKRAGSTTPADDIGLVALCLGRVSIRDLTLRSHGCDFCEPSIVEMYKDMLTF